MDWLKIMLMTRHHRTWHERAFWYAIAGKKFVAFVMRAVQELIEYIENIWHSWESIWHDSWKSLKYNWKYGWDNWNSRNSWKKRWGNSWWGRNFDFVSLVIVLSFFVLVYCVYPAEFLGLVNNGEKYGNIEHYFLTNPLALATLIGFPILIKRVSEVQKQTRAIQYNAANELLWSSDLGSRMAGIQALWRVAQTYPKEEYHNVMDVFAYFIKHPIPYEWEQGIKEEDKKAGKRKDIAAIWRHMGEKRMAGAARCQIDLRDAHLERSHLYRAHLQGVHLHRANLQRAVLNRARLEKSRLSYANLGGAVLYCARLDGAILMESHLKGAHLTHARLKRADLQGAYLELAIINEANFLGAKNLTQKQIKDCVFIKDHKKVKGKPKLPKGMKASYRELSFEEWKREKRLLLGW